MVLRGGAGRVQRLHGGGDAFQAIAVRGQRAARRCAFENQLIAAFHGGDEAALVVQRF